MNAPLTPVAPVAPLVILGSGLAGYTLAREWRKLDPSRELVVISRDGAGFYSKPMLSNALAGGKTAQSLVTKSAEQMAQDLRATVLARAQVSRIEAEARVVHGVDAQGAAFAQPYGDLVLALGADPIRLPLAGDAAERVLSVNDVDDFERFARQLEGARNVVVIGAGLIGCEFANDLLARGITPTVIDPADGPLSRLLPPEGRAFLRDRLAAAGVDFRFGVAVERVDADASGRLGITLTDGSRLLADAVLSAIGLRPRVGLAQAAGVQTARGIVVNRLLQTSVPGLHALGDCAEVRARAEDEAGHVLPYVMPLMQQARALAATLAGTPTLVVYPAMPVTVKTPACPAAVCPPPAAASGRWQVETDDGGLSARFVDEAGTMQGFALLGSAASQKLALAKLVPPLMG